MPDDKGFIAMKDLLKDSQILFRDLEGGNSSWSLPSLTSHHIQLKFLLLSWFKVKPH